MSYPLITSIANNTRIHTPASSLCSDRRTAKSSEGANAQYVQAAIIIDHEKADANARERQAPAVHRANINMVRSRVDFSLLLR